MFCIFHAVLEGIVQIETKKIKDELEPASSSSCGELK